MSVPVERVGQKRGRARRHTDDDDDVASKRAKLAAAACLRGSLRAPAFCWWQCHRGCEGRVKLASPFVGTTLGEVSQYLLFQLRGRSSSICPA